MYKGKKYFKSTVMTHTGGTVVLLLVPFLVRASLGDLCERAHLKRALDHRADANKRPACLYPKHRRAISRDKKYI